MSLHLTLQDYSQAIRELEEALSRAASAPLLVDEVSTEGDYMIVCLEPFMFAEIKLFYRGINNGQPEYMLVSTNHIAHLIALVESFGGNRPQILSDERRYHVLFTKPSYKLIGEIAVFEKTASMN